MRELTSHRVTADPRDVNNALTIQVEEPVSGPAAYRVLAHGGADWRLPFHHGTLVPLGVPNGMTNEALLAVLVDRLECLQRGPRACDENRDALRGLNEALRALKHRTVRRIEEGTVGTPTEPVKAGRLTITDDLVRLEGHDRPIPTAHLEVGWKNWLDELLPAYKAIKGRPTEEELDALAKLPKCLPAANGLEEFRQAARQIVV